MAIEPLSVQFVCLGNICRSPAAQGVMESLIASDPRWQGIVVDSAGTAGYHIGRAPDSRMIAAAKLRGHDLQSRAKQFERSFLRSRTLILAMDRENYRDIMLLATGAAPNVRLFSDYLDESWPRDVPDPYYGENDGFEYVLDMLEAGCPRILEEILGKRDSLRPE
jgi:protein-tyrosine phosphatase